MKTWDQYSAIMNGIVDTALGGDVMYSIGGGAAVKMGFVLPEIEPLDLEPIDEALSTRKRVKVPKSLVAYPAKTDRITGTRLGPGTFRPGGAEPMNQGDYWIMDVQKV